MTVHRDSEALNSNFIGMATLHFAGSLSAHHQFLAVHRHWYILCSFMTACYQGHDGIRSILPLVARGHQTA
jgi:hypothetical protein